MIGLVGRSWCILYKGRDRTAISHLYSGPHGYSGQYGGSDLKDSKYDERIIMICDINVIFNFACDKQQCIQCCRKKI